MVGSDGWWRRGGCVLVGDGCGRSEATRPDGTLTGAAPRTPLMCALRALEEKRAVCANLNANLLDAIA